MIGDLCRSEPVDDDHGGAARGNEARQFLQHVVADRDAAFGVLKFRISEILFRQMAVQPDSRSVLFVPAVQEVGVIENKGAVAVFRGKAFPGNVAHREIVAYRGRQIPGLLLVETVGADNAGIAFHERNPSVDEAEEVKRPGVLLAGEQVFIGIRQDERIGRLIRRHGESGRRDRRGLLFRRCRCGRLRRRCCGGDGFRQPCGRGGRLRRFLRGGGFRSGLNRGRPGRLFRRDRFRSGFSNGRQKFAHAALRLGHHRQGLFRVSLGQRNPNLVQFSLCFLKPCQGQVALSAVFQIKAGYDDDGQQQQHVERNEPDEYGIMEITLVLFQI